MDTWNTPTDAEAAPPGKKEAATDPIAAALAALGDPVREPEIPAEYFGSGRLPPL